MNKQERQRFENLKRDIVNWAGKAENWKGLATIQSYIDDCIKENTRLKKEVVDATLKEMMDNLGKKNDTTKE